jgi:AcrR family transcriptional regulator
VTSTPRKRLSPTESREAAVEAARALLVESGPGAVTLKAVAGRVGRTHANLLHHFGSAEALHTALITRMAADIVGTIGAAVLRVRAGELDPREVVEMTFDAFGKGGAGALASWMILSGNTDALDPILTAIHDFDAGADGARRCVDGGTDGTRAWVAGREGTRTGAGCAARQQGRRRPCPLLTAPNRRGWRFSPISLWGGDAFSRPSQDLRTFG